MKSEDYRVNMKLFTDGRTHARTNRHDISPSGLWPVELKMDGSNIVQVSVLGMRFHMLAVRYNEICNVDILRIHVGQIIIIIELSELYHHLGYFNFRKVIF